MLYSLLQNFPRDNNDLFCIVGKICAYLNKIGKCGISSKTVCDSVIMAPSGCFIVLLLRTGEQLYKAMKYKCNGL